ncbi:recombinase family protein [Spirosoma endophyticum]|uniref:Site-specific DNA recombinase n=1 Tax=Spirosoma endophyticum TaxID=662367 RepID=A0A1I2DH18_9BACT|nr:recombinase family protein [Spirosoma endophyticum]SFE79738.1 Site-specific DNA recombinase [Spirosoma endophyticum]
MKIGYARVSTLDQNLEMQIQALTDVGCERVFEEKVSGTKANRPQLDAMLALLRKGDEVIIWRLDRLGRSMDHLLDLVKLFEEKGVGLRSLHEHIETATPGGKLIFHLFSALAEFERSLTRERTLAGIEAARLKGRIGGKPKGLTEEAKRTARVVESLYKEGYAIKLIAKQLGIARQTVYKYLEFRNVPLHSMATSIGK